MYRLTLTVALAITMLACRKSDDTPRVSPRLPPIEKDAAANQADILDPNKLAFRTASQADERVRKVFPNGVATEDARSEIGTAPPPPEDNAPDRSSMWVAELAFDPPVELALVRATEHDPSGRVHFTKGQTRAEAWEYVSDKPATGPYVRIAVEVQFTDIDKPLAEAELDREITWTRAFFAKLDKQREPTYSMTKAQALAKAKAAFATSKRLGDSNSSGLVIVAPKGKKFPIRLVWDAVYSAGFRWGDGDYFHWVPSPTTDVSQGIGMGTGTGAGYFMPEWAARTDGSADVADVEMSFDVARCYKPEALFDVMVRAARYLARRLGGTVVTYDLTPFDEKAARARVTSMVETLKAAGLEPGSSLALQVF